jgi:hypothetical protein
MTKSRTRYLRVGCTLVLLSGLHEVAFAQTPLPGLGGRAGVGGTFQPRDSNKPLIGSSGETELMRHRDFAGKACLTLGGYARAFTTNATLFDHVVAVENGCPKAIKLQLCYYKTTECLLVEVPGYSRKVAILGTMPSQKDFQYEFREKF